MTIYEEALNGNITNEMKEVANEENKDISKLMKDISSGQLVIMKSLNCKPLGIGSSLRTKINVNLGTSSSIFNIDDEIKKARIAQKYGADTLSDLSMGGDIDKIRKEIIKNSTLPITTVPIYQAVEQANSLVNVSEDVIFNVIEKHFKWSINYNEELKM